MIRTAALGFVAAMLFAGPGFCQTASASATPSSAMSSAPARATGSKEAAYDAQVVCKHQGSTESRLGGEKVCRTREEWDELSRSTRAGVERYQNGVNMPH